MNYPTRKTLLLAVMVVCSLAVSASAQTPADFRARYGQPQLTNMRNHHVELERYLARPNIMMTVMYTTRGRACEAVIEPVPGSTPLAGRPEHAPTGDYMSTSEVIKIFNELVPIEQRGKKTNEMSMNGGDPEMKLHHPGCGGAYVAFFENVAFGTSTWCWGGTYSANIHWGKTQCKGQTITFKHPGSR